MRRTVRVLSVTLLTGAVVAVGPVVSAEPAAKLRPAAAAPQGSVTASVACDPAGAAAPAAPDASSRPFEEGAVRWQEGPGDDEPMSGPAYQGAARSAPTADSEDVGDTRPGTDSTWHADGTCPPPKGHDKPWNAPSDVPRTEVPPCTSHGDTCAGATVQHGVRAGEGGAFTDSVPALVAGALCIAGAVGLAVHRLRRRDV